MTACRSCGAEVIFVPSGTSGRLMILDARPEKRVVVVGREPIPRGSIVSDAATPAALRSVIERSPGNYHARVIDTYSDHHATCPQADEWKGHRRPAHGDEISHPVLGKVRVE